MVGTPALHQIWLARTDRLRIHSGRSWVVVPAVLAASTTHIPCRGSPCVTATRQAPLSLYPQGCGFPLSPGVPWYYGCQTSQEAVGVPRCHCRAVQSLDATGVSAYATRRRRASPSRFGDEWFSSPAAGPALSRVVSPHVGPGRGVRVQPA